MNPFKYTLDQTVFYLADNRIHSAPILSRMCVENLHNNWNCNQEQKELFTPWGDQGVWYKTCHGVWAESELFASPEDVAAALLKELRER